MKTLIAIAILAALVCGCTKSGGGGNIAQNATVTTGGPRGTLRVAIQSDVKNLNPLLNSNTTDGMIARLMFEPLLSANEKGVLLPMLATSVPTQENGGISRDGLTVTYRLRHDAKWTDGVAVTSKDVKWSWQALMNPNNNVISRHGYDLIAAVDTPDAYTVVVHLKRRFAPFVDSFFTDSDQPYPVAPAHVLAQYPNMNQIPFNSAPVVSDGPFKFVRWVRGDHIQLAANDAFFVAKPKLAGITVRIIPDENTSVNLLRTHELDWMFEASLNNYPNVKNIPGVRLVFVDVNGYDGMWLNTQRPLLHDPRVREAIAYAEDKQRLVNTLTFGQTRVATEDQPPFMWSYNSGVKVYPHDPQKARQLLMQAGWSPGPDGIMRKNGQRLSLELATNPSNVTRRKEAVGLQAMLREAGIDVQVKSYQGDVLFAPAGEGGILQNGRFDIGLAGWYAGVDPDDSTQLTCANVAPVGYNYSRYCNPDMEAAQKTALTNYDIPTRKKAYFRIQDILARDNPMLFTYYQRAMHPISVNFLGFAPNPVLESWNAWQWSI